MGGVFRARAHWRNPDSDRPCRTGATYSLRAVRNPPSPPPPRTTTVRTPPIFAPHFMAAIHAVAYAPIDSRPPLTHTRPVSTYSPQSPRPLSRPRSAPTLVISSRRFCSAAACVSPFLLRAGLAGSLGDADLRPVTRDPGRNHGTGGDGAGRRRAAGPGAEKDCR